MNASSVLSTFNLTNPELDVEEEEWPITKILMAVFFTLIGLTMIVGNALILYLFFTSKRKLRASTHYFLANMAVADLLVGMFVQPVIAISALNDFKWYWGDTACKGREYAHYWLCSTSMLSVMTIAVERYIGIRFPLQHRHILNKTRVAKIILLIWIVALAISAIPLTLWDIPTKPNECFMNLTTKFAIFISLAVYVVPVSIIAMSYYLIYRLAVKLYVPPNIAEPDYVPDSTNFTSAESINSEATLVTRTTRNHQSHQDTQKMQKVLAKKFSYIVATIAAMYGPLFILIFVAAFDPSVVTLDLLRFVGLIRYLSSSLNPIIYLVVIPDFKKAFLKLLWNEKSKLDSKSSTKSLSNSRVNENNHVQNIPNEISAEALLKVADKPNLLRNGTCTPIMSPRYCSYCGISILCREGQPCICGAFTKKPPPPPTSTLYTSETFAEKLALVLEPQKESPTSTLGPMYTDNLVSEVHSFLKVMNDSPSFRNGNDESIRNRASVILKNLMNLSPVVQFQHMKQIENLRTSVMIPVIQRGSVMLNPSNSPVEIDQATLQELDDIVNLLERTISF